MRDAVHRLDKIVFEVGGRPYTWLDVLLAADARGEWARFELMIAAGLEEYAADVSDAEVEAALVAFRRRRGLVAAEDARRWLARFGLARDSWRAAVRRSVLRSHRRETARDAGSQRSLFTSSIPPKVWWPDAVVSGALEGWARRAAEDLALVERHASSVGLRTAAATESPLPATSWLAAWPDAWARRAHFAEVAAHAREIEDAAVTPDAVRQAVATHPLEWTFFAIELCTFPTEAAAREALLCHRLDREPLLAIAKRNGVEVQTLECWMEDLPEDLRAPCIGARVEELAGPLTRLGGFSVLRLVRRQRPSPADPAAASRARDAIVGELRRRALRDCARFLLALEPR